MYSGPRLNAHLAYGNSGLGAAVQIPPKRPYTVNGMSYRIRHCGSFTTIIWDFDTVEQNILKVDHEVEDNEDIVLTLDQPPVTSHIEKNHGKPPIYFQLQLKKSDRPQLPIRYYISLLDFQCSKCFRQEYFEIFSANSPVKLTVNGNMIRFQERSIFNSFRASLLREGGLHVFCEFQILEEILPDPVLLAAQADLANTNRILQSYADWLHSGELSDLTLVAADKRQFRAHKLFLIHHSPVFAAMFQHRFRENLEDRIVIDDMDGAVLGQLLHFLYTGQIENWDQHVLELFEAADKYQLDTLKLQCEQYILSHLTPSIVANLLIIADLHQSVALKAKCLQFLEANLPAVKATDSWAQLLAVRPDLVPVILLDDLEVEEVAPSASIPSKKRKRDLKASRLQMATKKVVKKVVKKKAK